MKAKYVTNITIPMRLLSDRKVSSSAKLLYGLIDYYSLMSGGICYETNASLASRIRDCTQRTISRLVRELQNAGYIETTYQIDNEREIRLCK